MILDEKLAAGDVIVLDGATGTEVARLGAEMNPAAWCAVANRTHPDTVRRVHESYLEAGADVIITNTFATCRHVLDGAGLGDETVAINRRAVELAREARDRVSPDRPVAVAGSMSNTVAWIPGTLGPDPALPSLAREGSGGLSGDGRYPRRSGVRPARDGNDDGRRARESRHAGGVGHRAAGVGGHQHQPGPRRRDDRMGYRARGAGPPSARLRVPCTGTARDDRRRACLAWSPGRRHHAQFGSNPPRRGWKSSSSDGTAR